VSKLIFDPTEVKKEGEKTVAEAEKTLMNLKNQRAGFQNQINAIDKKASDDRIKTADEEAKALALLLKAQADANANAKKEVTDAIEQAQEKNNEFLLSANDAEIQKVNDKYFKLIEMAKQFNLDTVELEIAKANEINEINLKIQAEEESARLLQKELDEKALADKKILKEQELALSAETFGKVASLLGKNSKIGKAFAVGQALMNTYQGITAELATKAVTPYEIGLKVANIAFVASTGFKAVKNILSTNPMSSGGGGASSGGGATGGGASSAPQFNLVGQSSTNQLNATIAGQQNRPVQTFVVGSQVSTQQALDRNAVANSVFG
jgi:hypothetical protein